MEIQWADEFRNNVWHWRIVDATAAPIAACTANDQTADGTDVESIDANTEPAASVAPSAHAVPVSPQQHRHAMPVPGKCRHAVSTATTAAHGLHGWTTSSERHAAAKPIPLRGQKLICGKCLSIRIHNTH